MTPQSKIHKLDFTHKDERETIEIHNATKSEILKKLMKSNKKLKHKSCSPNILKSGYNFAGSNLKFLVHHNNSGLIDDTFS